MSHFDTELEAELLTQDVKNMLVKWGGHGAPRTGNHASAILVKESEWCLRELVLRNFHGEEAEQGEMHSWDWRRSATFETGWDLHRRIQRLHAKFGNVVWSPISEDQAEDIKLHIPPALHKFYVKIDYGKNFDHEGQWYAAELDLTHFDPERLLYFSPDMITLFGGQKYVWEIKGINNDAFAGTPRDEQGQLIKGLRDINGKEIKPQEGLTEDLDQACSANETVAKARVQANLYCHLLGIDKAVLHIENKSNQDFKLWVIEYSQERALTYTNRIYDVKGRTALVQRYGNSKLPTRVCQSQNDSRARKCPLKNVCFSQQEQESEEW